MQKILSDLKLEGGVEGSVAKKCGYTGSLGAGVDENWGSGRLVFHHQAEGHVFLYWLHTYSV